jgi:anthranilate phosphoribosyltransferase
MSESVQHLVDDVVAGRMLSVAESYALMHTIITGGLSDTNIAALLTALRIRGLDLDTVDGFSAALAEAATPVKLDCDDHIDLCGTGGDRKGSFNISTTVAFVVAGAGYRVAKHGNVGVSSPCGSSNVLDALGVPLYENSDDLKRAFDRNGLCFIHAPFFHPGFKRVAAVRRELGFRTVFNVLGPLINPSRPAFQCNGVYSLQVQRLYGYLLQRRGLRFAVVYSHDGYDEVSLTAPARVAAHCGGWELAARHFGLPVASPASLEAPSTPREGAMLINDLLSGRQRGAKRDVVIANAALAMWCFEGATTPLSDYVSIANESIDSGRALRKLIESKERV